MRIVVLGYIVRGPLGGMAWHHLQYVLGLAELGHDVCFLEDSDDYPSCYDPDRGVTDTDPSYGLRFASNVFERAGLANCWAYYDAHRETWHGPRAADYRRLGRADLLLNVSGVNPLRPWLLDIPRRVLIDTDPVFTQIRHLTDPAAEVRARQHNLFFSFGENLGHGDAVPDDGLTWQPTRQPIALRAWPFSPGPRNAPFTTVMQWDSYATREYQGRRYGMKADSFAPFMDLPERTKTPLELALGGPRAPRDLLIRHGWRLRDPGQVARDPWTYQEYLRQSKAEFSLAKHGYVVSRCGWFSERSAAYLALGRPVLVQDTGCSARLPTGAGLLTFANPDEALAAIAEIDRRYAFHCGAARAFAEEHFDSGKVLTQLLERCC